MSASDIRQAGSHIAVLSSEIMSEIFAAVIPMEWVAHWSSEWPGLVISAVCRRWRNVALGTPRLWQFLVYCGEKPCLGLSQLMLLRSGAADIEVYVRKLPATSDVTELAFWLGLIAPHHDRIRSIRYTRSELPTALQNLGYLLPIRFERLRSVNFLMVNLSPKLFLEVLRRCPSIEEFICSYKRTQSTMDTADSTMEALNLRALLLFAEHPSDILAHVTAPRLEKFYLIPKGAFDVGACCRFLRTCPSLLTKLSIPGFGAPVTFGAGSPLRLLITETSGLTYLRLSLDSNEVVALFSMLEDRLDVPCSPCLPELKDLELDAIYPEGTQWRENDMEFFEHMGSMVSSRTPRCAAMRFINLTISGVKIPEQFLGAALLTLLTQYVKLRKLECGLMLKVEGSVINDLFVAGRAAIDLVE